MKKRCSLSLKKKEFLTKLLRKRQKSLNSSNVMPFNLAFSEIGSAKQDDM